MRFLPRSILLLWSLFAVVPLSGQILYQEEGLYFDEKPFFNEDFIRRNKVKSLKGSISSKQQMDRIRSKGLEYYFEFDKKGRLVKQLETFRHSDKKKDTTAINYRYDEEGRVVLKRRNDSRGFFSYQFEYDEEGRLKKMVYSRETNVGPSRYDFELGERFVITSERYEYDTLGNGSVKCSVYNSRDKLYKEQFTKYDSLGYLKEKRSRLVITRRRSRTTFKHDEKGRLKERIEDHNTADTTKKRIEYKYDEVGNLEEMDHYINDQMQTHREYLYYPTMLLKAEILKDIETKLIKIVRYEVELYSD